MDKECNAPASIPEKSFQLIGPEDTDLCTLRNFCHHGVCAFCRADRENELETVELAMYGPGK